MKRKAKSDTSSIRKLRSEAALRRAVEQQVAGKGVLWYSAVLGNDVILCAYTATKRIRILCEISLLSVLRKRKPLKGIKKTLAKIVRGR